jgi:hypothetical protein
MMVFCELLLLIFQYISLIFDIIWQTLLLVSHNFFCHFNTGIFKMARTKQVPAKDGVAKAAAAPVKSMDVVGSPAAV